MLGQYKNGKKGQSVVVPTIFFILCVVHKLFLWYFCKGFVIISIYEVENVSEKTLHTQTKDRLVKPHHDISYPSIYI